MSDINQGISLYKEGKFEEALEVFNQLLANTPNQPIILLHRGRVLSRMGKLELALEDFDLLLKTDQYNADFISDRAVVLQIGRAHV